MRAHFKVICGPIPNDFVVPSHHCSFCVQSHATKSIQDAGQDKLSDDLPDIILHAVHVQSVLATQTKRRRQPFIYFYFLRQLGFHSSPGTVNSEKQHHCLKQTQRTRWQTQTLQKKRHSRNFCHVRLRRKATPTSRVTRRADCVHCCRRPATQNPIAGRAKPRRRPIFNRTTRGVRIRETSNNSQIPFAIQFNVQLAFTAQSSFEYSKIAQDGFGIFRFPASSFTARHQRASRRSKTADMSKHLGWLDCLKNFTHH